MFSILDLIELVAFRF